MFKILPASIMFCILTGEQRLFPLFTFPSMIELDFAPVQGPLFSSFNYSNLPHHDEKQFVPQVVFLTNTAVSAGKGTKPTAFSSVFFSLFLTRARRRKSRWAQVCGCIRICRKWLAAVVKEGSVVFHPLSDQNINLEGMRERGWRHGGEALGSGALLSGLQRAVSSLWASFWRTLPRGGDVGGMGRRFKPVLLQPFFVASCGRHVTDLVLRGTHTLCRLRGFSHADDRMSGGTAEDVNTVACCQQLYMRAESLFIYFMEWTGLLGLSCRQKEICCWWVASSFQTRIKELC